jgi:hypothetical protein
MLVQETIQPLLRYFSAGVTQDTNTPVVSIANAQAVRIVAHTGAVAGSATLRVFVNNVNDITGAVQIPSKAVPLASNSSYEIFVSGAEAYAAIARAAFLYVQIDVVENSSPIVPIAIEVSAFPGRSVPTSLPANWTRVL